MTRKFDIALTRSDMHSLKDGAWLNDKIIDFYLEMIVERSNNGPGPKCFAFNSHFYLQLKQRGADEVEDWSGCTDIFHKNLIFVPVFDNNNHWTLIIVNTKTKTIKFYDSKGSRNSVAPTLVLRYLVVEHMNKKSACLDWKRYQMVPNAPTPQQMNDSDCGVFLLTLAEFMSRNRPLVFCQNDMPYLRKRIVAEIMIGKLLTSFTCLDSENTS
ncbi:sentrin-specific protease 2-like [Aethina tumida]|uniref:sentrin-specific protease 2-like n=1 Tax=Aethina tumida TaxID=116153 RepID=UPI0021482316|nr:sentrin-specific protease 2-like [Aethina tumida]